MARHDLLEIGGGLTAIGAPCSPLAAAVISTRSWLLGGRCCASARITAACAAIAA
jgi:hypothetical protein